MDWIKFFYGIVLFIIFALVVSAWTPPSDADFRDYYKLSNVTNITAQSIFQNGSLVLTEDASVNSSTFSNSSSYWDNLNTPLDILISDLNQSGETDLTVNASTWWASVSSFQSRWFDDITNILTFNESLLNSTIDVKLSTIGNWSADQSSYYTITQVENFGYYNDTNQPPDTSGWSNTSTTTKTDLNVTINDTFFIGNSDEDHNIYFYEDASATGEYIKWSDSRDEFQISDQIDINGNLDVHGYLDTNTNNITVGEIISLDDIYTIGVGDDFWLGTFTQADADVQLNESGDAYFKNDVCLDGGICLSASQDTTYSAGNGISLSSTTFSVAGGDGLTQEASGLKVTPDGIGDTQLAFDTGQHLTTTSSVAFTNISSIDCIVFSGGGRIGSDCPE